MIEIIYNDSGKKGGSVIVKPPKNIRQIGSPRGRNKIYVEDYVYTFLHSTAFEGDTQKRAAVLLGKSEVSQDIRYTFISGAVSCDDFVFQGDGIIFDESCWEYIYKEIKQYFDSQEVVGWFLGMPGFPLEITPAMEAAHRKYFAGRDKVLFLSEPSEGEDSFYAYEQGVIQKKEGYYIYYEKNQPMQEYMVCTREKSRDKVAGIEGFMDFPGEPKSQQDNRIAQELEDYGQGLHESEEVPPDFFQEVEGVTGVSGSQVFNMDEDTSETQLFNMTGDTSEPQVFNMQEGVTEPQIFNMSEEQEQSSSAEQALQNFRSTYLEKDKKKGTRKMSLFLYTAASAAMVILCVIGITTLNNYEKMKEVEATLSLISQSSEKDTPASSQPSGLVVESVPGEVTKEGDKSKEENKAKDAAADGGTKDNTSADGKNTEAANGTTGTNSGTQGEKPQGTDPASGGTQGTEGSTAPDNKPAEGTGQSADNTAPAEGTTPGSDGKDAGQADQGTEGTNAPETDNKDAPKDSVQTSAQTYLEQGYYEVQAGDRLETICKNIYQTTAMLDKLCEANQIDDVDKIYAGQKLKLP